MEGHGVSSALMDAAFASAAALFALPAADKAALLATEATNNRGWTPLGEEVLDPERQTRGDTKEGYYIGREVAPDAPEASLPLHGACVCHAQTMTHCCCAVTPDEAPLRAGPNVWPPEALLPGWRGVMQAYFDACAALGMRLTRLLGAALGTPEGFFDEPGRFDAPQLFLRLLRYAPEASAPAEGVFGAGAHTDYGMLTLLATDAQPGLQIQPRAGGGADHACADDDGGEWFDVAPRRGAFIVNLGDMLERWTNGAFRSTRHRVVTKAHGQERFSIPFFFGARAEHEHEHAMRSCARVACLPDSAMIHADASSAHVCDHAEPNFHCVVECLPQCCGPDNPPRFPPTRAGEYLLSRYGDTHAAYGGAPLAEPAEDGDAAGGGDAASA